jgi:hypothetical protein
MNQNRKKRLELFKALTGRTSIPAPQLVEPKQGYWPAKGTERYYR